MANAYDVVVIGAGVVSPGTTPRPPACATASGRWPPSPRRPRSTPRPWQSLPNTASFLAPLFPSSEMVIASASLPQDSQDHSIYH